MIETFAPGRVNLIGEHTDYTGGLVLPMAVQMGTTVRGEPTDGRLRLRSEQADGVVDVVLPVVDARDVRPRWGRYPAAVAAELAAAGLAGGESAGFDGTVTSDLPIGGGLSSSASFEVATALALGAALPPVELAQLCQAAEHRATGVPCGIMDQLAIVAAVPGHATLIDCSTLEVTPIPMPDDVAVAVVPSGQRRDLEHSAYATRRAECEAAEREIGPLRLASPDDVASIADPVIRRRARHVVSENARVRAVASALAAGDVARLGPLLAAGHRSLRDDFEVSTPVIDELVAHLDAEPGVLAARLTGAGFGGCVVALCRPGTHLDHAWWVTSPGPPTRRAVLHP